MAFPSAAAPSHSSLPLPSASVCHVCPSTAVWLPKIPSAAPQMGAHVQPAYVKQLFGGMEGEQWKRRGGEMGPCLLAICGDIMRQSFSGHN